MFYSAEFESFLRDNGIQHLTTAPYHPASNDLAERAVQIIKKGLKNKKGTFRTLVHCFLIESHLRRPRSKLDLLRPNLAERVERKQQSQKEQHDSRSKEREFTIGTAVWVRNMQRGDTGIIFSKEGSVTYHVEMSEFVNVTLIS